jgi:hypothetical protein
MNNINPKLWGPHLWIGLHYITVSYPDNPSSQEKENMKQFFNSLGNVLPCNRCRQNYAQHLNKYPLTDNVLSSKRNLVDWLRSIHNEINIMNGKKPWTLQEVMDRYTGEQKKSNIIEIALIIILAIILIVILYSRIKKSKI